jgi:hypothetical protein
MRKLLLLLPLVVLLSFIVVLVALARAGRGPETTILYDGRLGTLPGAQAFAFIEFPAGATQTITNGGTLLDTMPDTAIYAGYFGLPEVVPVLDRAAGFTVTFTATLLAETHNSPNRAGFSIIALADDEEGTVAVQGIELGFWPGEIWAQDDDRQGGTLFTHAEGAAYDTGQLTRYDLAISADTYTLYANGAPLLSNRLRDYSNFNGFPDPYETPNFLFLGDDTSSAAGRVQLNHVAITNPIELDLRHFLPNLSGR